MNDNTGTTIKRFGGAKFTDVTRFVTQNSVFWSKNSQKSSFSVEHCPRIPENQRFQARTGQPKCPPGLKNKVAEIPKNQNTRKPTKKNQKNRTPTPEKFQKIPTPTKKSENLQKKCRTKIPTPTSEKFKIPKTKKFPHPRQKNSKKTQKIPMPEKIQKIPTPTKKSENLQKKYRTKK